MQPRDAVEGLYNIQKFTQRLKCLDVALWTRKSARKKVLLKNTREPKTSQPCLQTLI